MATNKEKILAILKDRKTPEDAIVGAEIAKAAGFPVSSLPSYLTDLRKLGNNIVCTSGRPHRYYLAAADDISGDTQPKKAERAKPRPNPNADLESFLRLQRLADVEGCTVEELLARAKEKLAQKEKTRAEEDRLRFKASVLRRVNEVKVCADVLARAKALEEIAAELRADQAE